MNRPHDVTRVRLPDGSSGADAAAALAALSDAARWTDSSSEMHVSLRDGSRQSSITVVRRPGLGVCLVCNAADDDSRSWASLGDDSRSGKSGVEREDVTLLYPDRFFIPVADALEALDYFCRNGARSPSVRWTRLRSEDLEFVI